MSSSKRARACDTCHSIKIKCELGSAGGLPPCERCVRLGKDCTVTPPRRQKDRVAELEAQVEALTRLLHAQNLKSANGSTTATSEDADSTATSPEPVPAVPAAKKRRMSNPPDAVSQTDDGLPDGGEALDRIVSPASQQAALRRYMDFTMLSLPVNPVVEECTYEQLHDQHPTLLAAIVFAAGSAVLSIDEQSDVADFVMNRLSTMPATTQKSVQFIQALQIASLWYRTTKLHIRLMPDQMLQMATTLARDVGLGKSSIGWPMRNTGTCDAINGAVAWRVWTVCYLLSAEISILAREPGLVEWGEHEDLVMFMLQYSDFRAPGDDLLAQCARAERLCERIALQSGLYLGNTVADVSTPAGQETLTSNINLIADWRVQIPTALICPTLDVWGHMATVLSHECVLHTTTNKTTFVRPFIADRLSATDFPTPLVTPEHVSCLEALRNACHALLETFLSFDADTLVSMPSMLFPPKLLYGAWILVKLYIALTGPRNTFGAFLSPDDLHVDYYLQRLLELGTAIRNIDEMCAATRIMKGVARLPSWLQRYRSMYPASLPGSVLVNPAGPAGLTDGIALDLQSIDWTSLESDVNYPYGLDYLFNDDLVLPTTLV